MDKEKIQVPQVLAGPVPESDIIAGAGLAEQIDFVGPISSRDSERVGACDLVFADENGHLFNAGDFDDAKRGLDFLGGWVLRGRFHFPPPGTLHPGRTPVGRWRGS